VKQRKNYIDCCRYVGDTASLKAGIWKVRETRRVSRKMSPSLKNIGLHLKCGGKNVNVKLLVYK
jgi:hypothetical protein